MFEDATRQPEPTPQPPPRIRYAACGELRIYQVDERELDELAKGSPTSLELNLAIALLTTFLSFLVTLLTTTLPSDRIFTIFVIIDVATFLAGFILALRCVRGYKSCKNLLNEIKDRMPPEGGIQETSRGDATRAGTGR